MGISYTLIRVDIGIKVRATSTDLGSVLARIDLVVVKCQIPKLAQLFVPVIVTLLEEADQIHHRSIIRMLVGGGPLVG